MITCILCGVSEKEQKFKTCYEEITAVNLHWYELIKKDTLHTWWELPVRNALFRTSFVEELAEIQLEIDKIYGATK